MTTSISLDTLKQAIQIKEEIATLEARLEKILGGHGHSAPTHSVKAETAPAAGKGRRKMSASARARIAAAQRARWAKVKGTAAVAAPAKPAKKKRKLSAEGRARIVAALKKRWAAVKRKK